MIIFGNCNYFYYVISLEILHTKLKDQYKISSTIANKIIDQIHWTSYECHVMTITSICCTLYNII